MSDEPMSEEEQRALAMALQAPGSKPTGPSSFQIRYQEWCESERRIAEGQMAFLTWYTEHAYGR